MNGSDCQALCREWSLTSRRRGDIAVRPVPVNRLPSPLLNDCPLPWGEGVPRRRLLQPSRDG